MVTLPPELQQAIEELGGEALRLVDPRTGRIYVLLAAELYERAMAQLAHGDELAQTYPAQIDSALRGGWAAPEMSDYDRYDELHI